jgi:hypothetical protein
MGLTGEIPVGTVAGSIVHVGVQGVASGQLGSVSDVLGVIHETGIAAWPEVEQTAGSGAGGVGHSSGQAHELSG